MFCRKITIGYFILVIWFVLLSTVTSVTIEDAAFQISWTNKILYGLNDEDRNSLIEKIIQRMQNEPYAHMREKIYPSLVCMRPSDRVEMENKFRLEIVNIYSNLNISNFKPDQESEKKNLGYNYHAIYRRDIIKNVITYLFENSDKIDLCSNNGHKCKLLGLAHYSNDIRNDLFNFQNAVCVEKKCQIIYHKTRSIQKKKTKLYVDRYDSTKGTYHYEYEKEDTGSVRLLNKIKSSKIKIDTGRKLPFTFKKK
ncbi:uncharacterized protein LOC126896467 [Daktulosphaira vitifoliae]|uniref:uncharacterized protein LOC126896467 n=1 Tax=Daktulosphaira vitifoliae TaxID=58002 RepID=UPI0021AA3AE4|nr:uncharacterized protein LOC126896467 [Daktulosphaira vitifoliae]